MSLYFEELVEEEQKFAAADPSKNKIIFTYPWIITIPTGEEDDQNPRNYFHGKFGTNFAFDNEIWYMDLSAQGINLRATNSSFGHESTKVWNGSCFISYNLFYHNDMRFMLHSSPRIKMTEIPAKDEFKTSETFVAKMFDAIKARIITKMVVFVELHLEAKYFYRPFEKPCSSCPCKKVCDEYPKEMENDYRFGFLKKSDFTLKCPDGDVPSRRIVLNITSKLMKKRFIESKDRELSLDHKIDVVKPIILFLHSTCFQMPETYNLDYALRLLIAIEYFDAEQKFEIRKTIEQSLCKKFIDEKYTFETILRWTSIACRQSLHSLEDMIASVIVNKFYYKWHQTFPVDTRNLQNVQYLEIFGGSEHTWMFEKVDKICKRSLTTNVILP